MAEEKQPINTGKKTITGRTIWRDPKTGEDYSERSTTFQGKDGRYYTMPTVDENGNQYSEDAIKEYVDKYGAIDYLTGEKLPKFKSEKDAIMYAIKRSDTRKQKEEPMEQQMELFARGGLRDEGGEVDEVSGNRVPIGGTKKGVRDDIDVNISEGEFVFPEDVTRYIGLEKLMQLRQEAKMGLKQMEAMGQMGNSEEATMPDDLPFGMADLIIVGGAEEKDAYMGGSMNYQEGGFVPASAFREPTYANPQSPPATATSGYVPTFVGEGVTRRTVTGSPAPSVIASEAVDSIIQMKQYVNDAGDIINLPFIAGQPVYPIPEGYSPLDPADAVDDTTEEVNEILEQAPALNSDPRDSIPEDTFTKNAFTAAGSWQNAPLDIYIKEAKKFTNGTSSIATGVIGALGGGPLGAFMYLATKDQKRKIKQTIDARIRTATGQQLKDLQEIKDALEGKGSQTGIIGKISTFISSIFAPQDQKQKAVNTAATDAITPVENDATPEIQETAEGAAVEVPISSVAQAESTMGPPLSAPTTTAPTGIERGRIQQPSVSLSGPSSVSQAESTMGPPLSSTVSSDINQFTSDNFTQAVAPEVSTELRPPQAMLADPPSGRMSNALAYQLETRGFADRITPPSMQQPQQPAPVSKFTPPDISPASVPFKGTGTGPDIQDYAITPQQVDYSTSVSRGQEDPYDPRGILPVSEQGKNIPVSANLMPTAPTQPEGQSFADRVDTSFSPILGKGRTFNIPVQKPMYDPYPLLSPSVPAAPDLDPVRATKTTPISSAQRQTDRGFQPTNKINVPSFVTGYPTIADTAATAQTIKPQAAMSGPKADELARQKEGQTASLMLNQQMADEAMGKFPAPLRPKARPDDAELITRPITTDIPKTTATTTQQKTTSTTSGIKAAEAAAAAKAAMIAADLSGDRTREINRTDKSGYIGTTINDIATGKIAGDGQVSGVVANEDGTAVRTEEGMVVYRDSNGVEYTKSLFGTLKTTDGESYDGPANGHRGNDTGDSEDTGGCVIATHAVASGAFHTSDKANAVEWCKNNLHNKWWGETMRRGYRHLGRKHITNGTAETVYKEFKECIEWANGKRPFNIKIVSRYVYRVTQTFVVGLFVREN